MPRLARYNPPLVDMRIHFEPAHRTMAAIKKQLRARLSLNFGWEILTLNLFQLLLQVFEVLLALGLGRAGKGCPLGLGC